MQIGIEARNNNSHAIHTYGSILTYTDNRYYPVLYAQENGSGIDTTTVKTDGINKNDSYYKTATTATFSQASNLLTVTADYYIFTKTSNYSETLNYFDDKAWYSLIFNSRYYLASRCVDPLSNGVGFYVRTINDEDLYRNLLCYSYNGVYTDEPSYIRPIVTLNPNIKLYGGDGSKEHPYQLTK